MKQTMKAVFKSFLPRLNGVHILLLFMLGYTMLIGPLTVSTMLLIVVFGLAGELLLALKEIVVQQYEGKDGGFYMPGVGWVEVPEHKSLPTETEEGNEEPLSVETDVEEKDTTEENSPRRKRAK